MRTAWWSSFRRGAQLCSLLWCSLAFLATCSLVLFALLPWRQAPINVSLVPVQHFKDALDDITQKQAQLCQELAQLQSYLAGATRWRGNPLEGLKEPKLEGEPRHRMQPTLLLRARGVVLTSFFSGASDPLYSSNPGRQKQEKGFGYMDLWYQSVPELKLPALVFHDIPEATFEQQWASQTIKFSHVDLAEGFYSLNDARFVVFHDWLECCAHVEYVLVTDIRDVRIARNPFALFSKFRQYDLFVNTDRNNPWMLERFTEAGYPRPALAVLFNAGVFGGAAAAMRYVLQEMLQEFRSKYTALLAGGKSYISNLDMAVLNHVLIERASKRWRIFTGRPFVGGQVQCELFFECDLYVYHKWVQPGELPPCSALVKLGVVEETLEQKPAIENQVWTVGSEQSF